MALAGVLNLHWDLSEELLVDAHPFETRIALMRGGEPVEFHFERPTAEPGNHLVGNIYLGRIVQTAPAIQAAFVDIGTQPLGALFADPDDDVSGWREGEAILVQVAKAPRKGRLSQARGDSPARALGKGPRLSGDPSLAGRYVVALPLGTRGRADSRISLSRRIADDDERSRLAALLADVLARLDLRWDCIVRTAAAGAARAEIEADLRHLHGLWRQVRQRRDESRDTPTLLFEELPPMLRTVRDLARPCLRSIVVNDDEAYDAIRRHAATHMPAYADRVVRYRDPRPLFDAHGLEAAIDDLLDPRVPLPSGGRLVIEQTEAMTTIDVDSGSRLDAATRADTALKTNLEAAAAIPRQLRLRNIGGIVVVDFIGMASDAHRDAVHAALVEAAADDPARFEASAFSALGLVEISRRRLRDSLLSELGDDCAKCAGRGVAKSAMSTCYDLFRAVLRQAAVDGAAITAYDVHAAEPVIDRLLDEEADHLESVSRRTGRRIRLHVEPGYRTDQFDLIGGQSP